MNIELCVLWLKLIIRLNLECGFVSSSGPIGNIDFSIMSAIIQWFFSKNIFSLPWNKEYRAIFCLLFTILFYFILFFSTGDVGNYYYGQGHPMKPHRIRMTHNLLLNYGLYRKMEIYVRNSSLLLYTFLFFFFSCFLTKPISSFVCMFSGLIRPMLKKWPSTTVTTTSSSFVPSAQTTCLSTASRCRDVSWCIFFTQDDQLWSLKWQQ